MLPWLVKPGTLGTGRSRAILAAHEAAAEEDAARFRAAAAAAAKGFAATGGPQFGGASSPSFRRLDGRMRGADQ